MTLQQFQEVPYFEYDAEIEEFDSLVLLPTNIKHDSGFNLYAIVVCLGDKPLGMLHHYDTFRLDLEFAGIDCLRKSELMRIFLERGRYKISHIYHCMKLKGEYYGKE